MDTSKLYICGHGKFRIVAAEGDSLSLREGVQRYKQSGKYGGEVDFSPVLRGSSDEEDFMAANIYGSPFCTLTAIQHHRNRPNTSLVSIGIGDLSLELLVGLADSLQMVVQDPSKKLIEEAQIVSMPLYLSYKQVLQYGNEIFAFQIISQALKEQQQRYILDARKERAKDN